MSLSRRDADADAAPCVARSEHRPAPPQARGSPDHLPRRCYFYHRLWSGRALLPDLTATSQFKLRASWRSLSRQKKLETIIEIIGQIPRCRAEGRGFTGRAAA